MRMKLSTKGFDFIKGFEKFEAESYPDQGDVWTIGYGTTRLNGFPVSPGMVINEKVATALAMGDLLRIVKVVSDSVKVELNQNQIDALVSLAYNIGDSGFLKSSLLLAINRKLIINEDLFTRWNRVTNPKTGEKEVSNGLLKRRKQEYNLFISKEGL